MVMARKRTMNQRRMRLLWGEEDLPELRPELPENQATTVSRTEATTSSLRAGCAKKLFQSPQAKIMTAICTIRANVEMIAIRRSKRGIGISKANLFLRQSEEHGLSGRQIADSKYLRSIAAGTFAIKVSACRRGRAGQSDVSSVICYLSVGPKGRTVHSGTSWRTDHEYLHQSQSSYFS
jgi:hypothetical protein